MKNPIKYKTLTNLIKKNRNKDIGNKKSDITYGDKSNYNYEIILGVVIR